ncbi:MAG: FAD:protein FMN transferase [Deltaproteobacteria bacterium]|nr:FAD:protein FMN transferase [Deltaproteobacteria bacterium]
MNQGWSPLGRIALVLAIWGGIPSQGLQAETVKEVRKKMGSRFEITVVHNDEAAAQKAIEAGFQEIERIENLISSWREDSETNRIQRLAGQQPVVVSEELFELIRRSLKVSRLTDGAFDITFATVGNLWDFKAAEPKLPAQSKIDQALKAVGYRNVVLDETSRTVFLRHPETRIGFGAIGKGYAANRTVKLLKELGARGGVVNAGGDLLVFGRREDGQVWRVGIADPVDRDSTFAYLKVTDLAVVTSGDYESFFVFDGKTYSHILDPRTGFPVEEVRGVTVLCPDAELADALATSVSVLGINEGLELVDQLTGVEALLVDRAGNLHSSRNLTTLLEQEGREKETTDR